MPEMIALADRIVVMGEFRVLGELANDHDSERTSHAIMGMIHSVEEAA